MNLADKLFIKIYDKYGQASFQHPFTKQIVLLRLHTIVFNGMGGDSTEPTDSTATYSINEHGIFTSKVTLNLFLFFLV